MTEPDFYGHDTERFHSLCMLDLPAPREEKRFDRLLRVARRCFCAPVALISLAEKDRQWLITSSDPGVMATSGEKSFRSLVVWSGDILVVEDASTDTRYSDNPLVKGEPFIRFYAGCPLHLPDGAFAGMLCVMDTRPRIADEEDLSLLKDLASLAEDEFYIISVALTDALTGVLNRRGFYEIAAAYVSVRKKGKQTYGMVLFDLDNLKPVNDRFGHLAGDRLLKQFAGILRQCASQSDIIARLGGDEFVVLTECTDIRELLFFTSKMAMLTEVLNNENDSQCFLNYSWGFSINLSGETLSLSDMLIQSDEKMYENKRAKKAGVSIHTDRHASPGESGHSQ
ncbi:putative diguanylate cyclase YeaP [Phytobacter ursingii]|nr:putative diguanylate cyclase YeaP [Phytobacter ursingii]